MASWTCNVFHMSWFVGWLDGFNVGLELRSDLLPTVWDSCLRTARRHDITILIFHGGGSKNVQNGIILMSHCSYAGCYCWRSENYKEEWFEYDWSRNFDCWSNGKSITLAGYPPQDWFYWERSGHASGTINVQLVRKTEHAYSFQH